MTLQKFQRVIKSSLVFIAIACFGIVTFSIGKVTAGNDIDNVKGVSADREVVETPIPSEDFQSPKVFSSSIKLCSNPSHGFEIAYGSDLFTTHNTEEQKCTFFAPYSFVVPYFIEKDFVPINIEIIEPDNWLSTIKFYENPNDFYNVTSSQNIEVSGRLIKKIEALTTGEGSSPRGYFTMHLLVFDGDKPMRLSYTQLDESVDVENAKARLLEMVKSLSYF